MDRLNDVSKDALLKWRAKECITENEAKAFSKKLAKIIGFNSKILMEDIHLEGGILKMYKTYHIDEEHILYWIKQSKKEILTGELRNKRIEKLIREAWNL
jgi:hypothetical protein